MVANLSNTRLLRSFQMSQETNKKQRIKASTVVLR